jgi:DHA1 family multidrug resistance protein-like MFS transporter
VLQTRGLSAGVIAVTTVVFIANLGNNIVAPIMPAIKDQFGSSAAQVALVASGFGLGRLVMDLPAGYLTDRISPSKLFAAGILVSGVAAAFAAFSTTLEQLILFRTAMGFGSSIMIGVALVLLIRIAPADQRGTVLGFYMTAQLLAQAISPTIGGYLATIFSWRAAFVFCALTPLVSFPLNLVLNSKTDPGQAARNGHQKSSRTPAGPSPSLLSSIPNWPAFGTVLFTTFANFFNRQAMRSSLLPLYAGMVLGLDPGTIGVILTAGSILTIAINIPSGVLADRVGKKTLLVPGLLTLAVGNLVFLTGDSTPIFIAGTLLISMGVLSP